MKYFFVLLFVIMILIGFWSVFVEPNLLVVRNITVENPYLRDLKVVFASDFHVKPYEKFRLKQTINLINKQHPDIVLLGGDYVNGHRPGFTLAPEDIAKNLSHIKSKYGTVAVMGNHDGWQGKFKIIKAFEKNGITVLENQNKDFGKFTIAGVKDLQTSTPDIKKAMFGVGSPVILLTHTPDVFPEVPEGVALTLAGHLHGGQIVFPDGRIIAVPSKYGTRYLYGLKKEHGKIMYVTNGIGTSILPIRFNCVPEIVVINFAK